MPPRAGEESVRLSLLDRLINDPDAPNAREASIQFMRETVRRDLEDLFNSKKPWTEWPDSWSELTHSLANYGLADFTGVTYAGSRASTQLTRTLEEVIRCFEPRLTNVQVEVHRSQLSQRTLSFRVKAVLRMDPFSEQISFDSDVEPVTRVVRVKDTGR